MLKIEQQPSYSESCLPRTIELALQNKGEILSAIGEDNSKWSFEDRVLVWLIPSFYGDVRNYYETSGPQMSSIFQPHHLEHFDSDFRERLAMRLEVMGSVGESLKEKPKSIRSILCPHCHKSIPEISQYIAVLRLEYEQLWDRITTLEGGQATPKKGMKILFVASKFRKYFHRPECNWMQNVPSSSLMTFASRDDASNAGFKPCRTCRA